MSKEPCPVCTMTGGYCGGSGHPSCGCFVNGHACSEVQEEAYASTYRLHKENGYADWIAQEAAYRAALAA